MNSIKPDELIPPDGELAQMLLQWSESADTSVWRIANVTNELIDELEGGIVTRQEIYKAVAARCKGRKMNTIRRWAEVARDFSPTIQKKYVQLLSFEHFRASRRLFYAKLTPSVDYGLKWCVEGNDHKLNAGKFHTVGEMLNQFVPEFKNKGADVVWNRYKDTLYDTFLLIDNDTDRSRVIEAWDTIEFVLNKKPALDKPTEEW